MMLNRRYVEQKVKNMIHMFIAMFLIQQRKLISNILAEFRLPKCNSCSSHLQRYGNIDSFAKRITWHWYIGYAESISSIRLPIWTYKYHFNRNPVYIRFTYSSAYTLFYAFHAHKWQKWVGIPVRINKGDKKKPFIFDK